MQMNVLNEFFHRSREWPRASRGMELFDRVAAFFRDLTDLDSGFLLYAKHDIPADSLGDNRRIYAPWGVFEDQAQELEEFVDWVSGDIETCEPVWQQWTPENIPENVRTILRSELIEVGIGPILVGRTIQGAVVVARSKNASSFLTTETRTMLLNAVSSQLSLALDLILAVRAAEAASHRDPLTGLNNRRGLEANLPFIIEQAQEKKNFLVFGLVDLDGLKTINDTQGHPAGDKALQRVATVLIQSVREGDLVSRYGGDEFVVVLQMDNPDVETALLRIQENVERFSRGYSVSVGGALLGIDGDLQRCYHIADQRLYEGKRTKMSSSS